MKTIQVILLTTGMFFSVYTTSTGQGYKSSQEHQELREHHRGRMNKNHAVLNEEQREQIKALREEQGNKMKELQMAGLLLKAKQKTLLETKEPNLKAIEKNIDALVQNDAKLAKLRMEHMVAVREIIPVDSRGRMMAQKRLRIGDGIQNHQREGKKSMANRGRSMQRKGSFRGEQYGQGNAFAQKGQKQNITQRPQVKARKHVNNQRGMFLSDGTMEKMKESRIKVSSETREYKNKIGELAVQQKTFLMMDNLNLDLINDNIDDIAKLKAQIMKSAANEKVALLQAVTPEEKEIILSHGPKKNNSKRRHHRL